MVEILSIVKLVVDDADFLNQVFNHEKIFPFICDDGAVHPVDASALLFDPTYHLLAPMDDGKMIGIFAYSMLNTYTCEVHSQVLPEHRGRSAFNGAVSSLKWIAQTTNYLKVCTNVPSFNTVADGFAVACGMKKEGVNRKSFMKDGKLYDQTFYGITKEEILCL